MRSTRTLVLVIVGIVVAVVLALLGLAALQVGHSARADDRRIVNSAGQLDAQQHDRDVGVRLGEALLGVADDRVYRDAVWLAKAAALPNQPSETALELRAEAEGILGPVVRGDGEPALRSQAANLLGALYFADAKTQQNPRRYLEQALGAFQDAVSVDPSNVVAKGNLELLATVPPHTRFPSTTVPGAEATATPNTPGGY